nr:DUF4411 family protein [Brevibacterium sp. RIT 803]
MDADSMIDAKNRYYGFDIAPGYWDWLVAAHHRGTVHTVKSVRDEVELGNDQLAMWMKGLPKGFSISPTAGDATAFETLATWAEAGYFKDSAASEFQSKGDFFLVGQSLSNNSVVVTNELSEPNRKSRVKIPDACDHLGVECITAFEMLRRERVQLK